MKKFSKMGSSFKRLLISIQVIALASAGIVPLLNSSASAAVVQLSSRSVSSTTAVPSAPSQLVFTFTTTDKSVSTNVEQIELEFCDAPLGTCAGDGTSGVAADNIPTINGSPTVTMGGTWAGATTTVSRENGDNGGTGNQIKIVYTTPGNENNKSGLTITVPSTTITNDNTANVSYYARIRLYSDTGTTLEWQGAVAQATSQTLTINGRVQELLSFCVGATAINNATTQIVPDCSTAAGTSVDLGTITNNGIAVTPVSGTTGGDSNNAYAMVQTNAQNGVVINYRALQDTSSGKMKVVGATCSGVSTTDQCFNSQGTTQGTFTAGTENFGMTIAGVNCASVSGSAYTCTFASGCTNLQPQANYRGDTYTYSAGCAGAGTFGTSNGFAWDDTGTAQTIASSGSSTQKVVSNEAIVLKFAATAQVTTPTGLYQTQADFIATPTF